MIQLFRHKNLVAGMLCLLLLLSLGCRKAELNQRTVSSESQALAGRLFADLFMVATEAVTSVDFTENGALERFFLGDCVVILIGEEHQGIINHVSFSVDFTEEGCTGKDGMFRSGAIFFNKSDAFFKKGAVMTVRLENYKVGGYQLIGNITITNSGEDENGLPGFDYSISNAEVVTPDGEVVTWEAIYRWRQVLGEETNLVQDGIEGIKDDAYIIYGRAEGLDEDGRNYTADVISPLSFSSLCHQFVAGTEEIRPDGLANHQLEYGAGRCDNMADVELENDVHRLFLR